MNKTNVDLNSNLNLEDLSKKYDQRLHKNKSLARYTSWHVGGKADYIFEPLDQNDLICFLSDLQNSSFYDIPIYFLGLGSNVLIRDGGLRGIVIVTYSSGKEGGHGLLDLEYENNYIVCGAGVACAKLAKFLAKNNYPNGAFWAGIPGSFGGALAMNAGCYGSETWDYVIKANIITRSGVIHTVLKEEFDISYRTSNYPKLDEYWFVSAYLQLPNDDSICSMQKIKDLLQKRASEQPIGKFSCGSVFRNPPGNHSAKLIEMSNLKGYRIGGAEVSTKHANFIINDKTATALEIEELIYYVQSEVEKKFGIKLQPEVKIIGDYLKT